MAIISVSGETGCPHEELAGLIAQKLSAELLTEAGLQRLVEAEFPGANIPEKAWKYVLQLIVASVGARGRPGADSEAAYRVQWAKRGFRTETSRLNPRMSGLRNGR